MKRLSKIFVILTLLLSVSGCQKKEKEPEPVELKGDLASDISPCEALKKTGEDLNKNGCLYEAMEDGESIMFYLPQNTFSKEEPGYVKDETVREWALVTGFNSFVKPEDYNIDYVFSVLQLNLCGMEDPFYLDVNDGDGTALINISQDMAEQFAKKFDLIDAEGNYDYFGIAQVMTQCFADTIYQAFPNLDLGFYILGLDEITNIKGTQLVSKVSYLPYFFGSKDNYIGDESFDDYVRYLSEHGVTLDSYSEESKLFVVNTFLYSNMLREDGVTPTVYTPTEEGGEEITENN